MSEWSHLPNAAHIDRVIESANAYPEVWSAARRSAWSAAWEAAQSAAWLAARNAAWLAARRLAWLAARDAARYAVRAAARDAIVAFIAYDDAAKYLSMTSDQLKAWAILSDDPASILLLPAVIAYERISEVELA